MSQDLTACNATLQEFAELVESGRCNPWEGTLRTGIDLGTANIVLAVVDEQNRPVAGASYPSTVVRDGIVVDYMGAVRAVTQLKAQLEERLGTTLDAGACAIPPGIRGRVRKPPEAAALRQAAPSLAFEVTRAGLFHSMAIFSWINSLQL